MSEITNFHVGDVFAIFDQTFEKWRYVILSRALITKEHFFLQSLTSFEPYNDRVVTFNNRFENTRLNMEQIQYLSDSSEIKFLGDIEKGRKVIIESLEKIFDTPQVPSRCA